jgi:hypothetical protein
MMIHPLEATGYYCIFYGSFLLFPVHYIGVIVYMAIHGLTGILDHSGIKLKIPYLYDTEDHGGIASFLMIVFDDRLLLQITIICCSISTMDFHFPGLM